MASRRQVRQAAVQLLYARSTSPDIGPGPEFWDLINDRGRIGFDRTRVKILAHLQQGREATAGKLDKIFRDHSANLAAVDPAGKTALRFKEIAEKEAAWAESSGNVVRLSKADIGGWRRELETLLPRSGDLKKERDDLLAKLQSLPPLLLKSITQVFGKLDEYDARVHMVRFPGNHPERRELDQLHRMNDEMTALADQARELGEKVEACQNELDAAIGSASENFELSRLGRVDLAILRLATWEILKQPDLDAAISITEAVDLARAFSGEESAAFVNGVLDQIAKS